MELIKKVHIGEYKAMYDHDKKQIASFLKRGFPVFPSKEDHYITIGGIAFNGFSLKDIEEMCKSLNVVLNIGA